MITQRRVFQAKVGMADAVVAKIQEFESAMKKRGFPEGRVFTDFHSGQTDQVAWEIDMESLAEFEKAAAVIDQDAEAMKFYETWYDGMKPLINGASVSLWGRVK